jgi:NHL repeat-containing protein
MSRRPLVLALSLVTLLATLPAVPARAVNLTTYASGSFQPIAIAFDPSGNLYATGSGGGLFGVWKAPPGGGTFTPFVTTDFADPWGIVCDPDGNVYVADRNGTVANGGKIVKITPAGVATLFKGGLQAPTGLAMDASGNLYTGVYNFQKVLKLTPAAVVSDFATGLGVLGEQLYQIDFGDDGNLYAGIENRIIRIGAGGSPVTTIVSGIPQAMGIARWTGDNFIVGTYGFRTLLFASPTRGNPAVNQVNTALVNHCTDGIMTAGASVNRPTFLTIHDDHVYIADGGCGKVRRFALSAGPTGLPRRTWGAVKSMYR